MLQDRDYRLEWAEKIGTGFTLAARSIGIRGLLSLLESGGREGIRTPGLLVANSGLSFLLIFSVQRDVEKRYSWQSQSSLAMEEDSLTYDLPEWSFW